jgi:hypothetical protein
VVSEVISMKKRYFSLIFCNERRINMSLLKKTVLTLIMLLMVVSFVACEKEGPAERAGKKLDKTVEDVKKSVKE